MKGRLVSVVVCVSFTAFPPYLKKNGCAFDPWMRTWHVVQFW
jgi:hypothetical protein